MNHLEEPNAKVGLFMVLLELCFGTIVKMNGEMF